METMLDTITVPVPVVRVNVDRNPVYALQYQVMGTPTFVLLDDTNTERNRVVGAISSKNFQRFINDN